MIITWGGGLATLCPSQAKGDNARGFSVESLQSLVQEAYGPIWPYIEGIQTPFWIYQAKTEKKDLLL